VFVDGCVDKKSRKMCSCWTETLSHEALELLVDPLVNLWAAGEADLKDVKRTGSPYGKHKEPVLVSYEVCDPVQGTPYEGQDGVRLADFVYPHYFTSGEEEGSGTDNAYIDRSVPSFGIA